MAKKVSIEVGHGGKDPGAVSGSVWEKNITRPVALALRDELERYGVDVLISRTTDADDPAANFKTKITAYKPDIGISVHFNASANHNAKGFEAYQNTGASSFGLCKCIEDRVKALGMSSRGIKLKPADNLGIMTACAVYAYLEGGFIDCPADLAYFDNAEKQARFGVAYARGILDYLGIAWKNSAIPKRWNVQVGAFSSLKNADKFLSEVKAKGIGGFVDFDKTKKIYRVQVGTFSVRSNADKFMTEIRAKGFDAIITES